MRRVLQRIDGDALDIALASWLATREPDRLPSGQDPLPRPRRSLAVDSKTVRGGRRSDGTQVHPLAAMTTTGLVTAQHEVDGRDEIRRVKTTTVADLDFPHATQTVQVVRRRRTITASVVPLERVYTVTDLTADQAGAAEIVRRIRPAPCAARRGWLTSWIVLCNFERVQLSGLGSPKTKEG